MAHSRPHPARHCPRSYLVLNAATMNYDSNTFHQEYALAERAGCLHIFDGLTTIESRREALRKAIIETGLADEPITHRAAKGVTFRQIFIETYKEPL
jgi:hypothetical protein